MESKKVKFEDCELEIEKRGNRIAIYQQVIFHDLVESGREVELLEDWLIAEGEMVSHNCY